MELLKASQLAMRKCVETDKNLFEDVASGYMNAKDIYKTQYTILDYGKILDDIISFVDGYDEYKKQDNKKYDGKVLSLTRNFYDKMFTEKKYRKKINLEQFREVNLEYLNKTKKLQDIIENYLKDEHISNEMHSLLIITNNQYKKLSKVCRDDMKIFLWLTSSNSKFKFNISEDLRKQFSNKSAPVMHKYEEDRNGRRM